MTVSKRLSSNSGFTTCELAIILTLCVFLLGIFISGCGIEKIKQAFIDEARVNLTVIAAALERYATDHDGEYPEYILGGDKTGWDPDTGCDSISKRPPFALNLKQTNLKGGGGQPPYDALIDGGYLDSYPANPFLDERIPIAPSLSGGEEYKPGTGDIRFGFNGNIMGNALDDPRYLWARYPAFGKVDKIWVQPTRLVNTLSLAAWGRGFGSLHHENEINPFYSIGGIPDPANHLLTRNRWWPGMFFYRSSGEMVLREDMAPEDYENAEILTIWDFKILKRDKFILGAYLDTAGVGLDLIRLTDLNSKVIQNRSGVTGEKFKRSLKSTYPEDKSVYMSPPEIFGGGNADNAPVFPYLDENGDFIYGAPDGYPDGIISPVLLDGGKTIQ